MPRSTNPHSYESFFWQLLNAMKSQATALTFEMPAHKAHRIRHRAYAFLYSLERDAHQQKKAGNIELAASRQADANTFRGYLIRVEINGQATSVVRPHDPSPAQLQFINRDLSVENIDLLAQLEEQTKDLVPPQDIADAPILTDLSDLFDSPLQTRDADGNQYTDGESST